MKRILSLLLIFLIKFNLAYSQSFNLEEVHPLLLNAVNKLQAEGIDSIFIYHSYCTGCDSPEQGKNCKEFLAARLVWKKNGEGFSKLIFCDGREENPKLCSLNAFDFFLKNQSQLTGRKLLEKGRFYPPVPVHHKGENFYLVIQREWVYTNLLESQKSNVEWRKYSWIKYAFKLSDLNKVEIEK